MAIPGSAGWSLTGDKSLAFLKDPISFAEKNMDKHSTRTFISRLLNKPTVFVCDYFIAKKLLSLDSPSIQMGYKRFWQDLFGDCVIFLEGEEVSVTRGTFQQLLTSISGSQEKLYARINQIIQKTIDNLPQNEPVNIYRLMKATVTEICLSIFLDLDPDTSPDLYRQFARLTVEHWRGIISVPLSVRGMGMSSTYSSALAAKRSILEHLSARLPLLNVESYAQDSTLANLLLLSSALIPKSLASILTSTLTQCALMTNTKINLSSDADTAGGECCKGDNCPSQSSTAPIDCPVNGLVTKKNLQSEMSLDALLLEVMRLWPSFLGGRRMIEDDVRVSDVNFPKGHAAFYLASLCHRDQKKFPEPDAFRPERWTPALTAGYSPIDLLATELLTLGNGTRSCLGNALVWHVTRTFTASLLEKFHLKPACDLSSIQYKYLPVARPKNPVLLVFQKRTATG